MKVKHRVGFLRASWHPRWHKISRPHRKYLLESPHKVSKIKALIRRNRFLALKWYLLPQEKMSCHRTQKENPCCGEKFLWQEDISAKRNKKNIFQRNTIPVKLSHKTGFMSNDENSCHKKKIPLYLSIFLYFNNWS